MRNLSGRLRGVAAAGLVVAAAGVVIAGGPGVADEKHIIVTVVDAQTNKPVKGLPADAFAVREDNLDCEVVGVAPATDPVAVVLLADTTSAFGQYVRDLRTSSQAFLKTFLSLNPGSSAALWEFGGAGMPVVDFTNDPVKLDQAATKLFPKGSLSNIPQSEIASAGSSLGGQNITASNLLEGIADAAKELANRPEARRVLVSFNSDLSVEASKLPGKKIQDEVQKANATWFAVSLQEQVANGPLRDNVINVLSPYSGGFRTTVVNIAALEPALTNIADILASQYVVTYRRPAPGAKQVAIGLRRMGLKAMTARWAPR